MIGFSMFSGEVPRSEPRLLAPTSATLALNTRLETGALSPMRLSRFETSLNEFCQTIYRFNGKWLGWSNIVDAAPAPVAEDRLYYTGDGKPKVMIGDKVFDLRVPGPSGPLSASVSGTPDPELSSVILYAYTFVTKYGEESEPSPLGTEVLWSPKLNVTVDGFEQPIVGRDITKMRIYKSQTSALGTTTLFFIHERDVTTAPFVDKAGENPLVEPITSTDFNPPPDDLEGIAAGPNGMMAAFRGKEVYFSEPYQPHAWPEKYTLKTNYKIVSVAWFDNSLAILTEGSPYVAQGLTPDVMAMERIKVNLPCVSGQGVVDMGYSVAYPSTEGLVMVSASAARVVTDNLFTREQWNDLVPRTIIAGTFSGKYVMAFTKPGQSESSIIVIDLTGAEPFLSRADQNSQAMFNEVGTGELFVLRDGFDIYQWDDPDQAFAMMTWRSKPFVMTGDQTMGVFMVETGDYTPQAGDTLKVTITADNKVMEVTKLNKPARLKSGFRAKRWQIEVHGNVPVTAMRLATGIDDLVGG
ncbi:hypothetical protein SKUL_22 [Pseudomonas phage Skulduggery]|uniref:Uncharacterized protein n=1 Tax=Pseudomonas phage Skulduggery TaxID=2006671 RepID=A0A1Y0SUC7_9CAUD|nr:hypothetical protein PP627_gp22 [Pseudomonas phage Skulduggery]ARV77121.1 hypothetical protein SKUL_22 [Pseudomonas phage Skulduggery]